MNCESLNSFSASCYGVSWLIVEKWISSRLWTLFLYSYWTEANERNGLGMKKITFPQPKLNFRPKKRGGALQIRQKFNQLGLISNFQGKLRPITGCDWRWKILPPISQNSILGKKKGGGWSSHNQATIQPTGFVSNFQVNNIFFIYPKLQSDFFGKNRGNKSNSAKNSTESEST